MRFERMSGLGEEQLSEIEYRIAGLLEELWDKGEGCPRGLTLRETLVVTCGYLRQDIIEDVGRHLRRRQSAISRYVTFLMPLVGQAV